MIVRIIGIVLPVVLIILVGYLYGRRARPDLRGMNQTLLELLAPFLVLSAFTSRDFSLLDNLSLLVCCVVVVFGSGVLAWALARALRIDVKTFVPPMMFNNCGNMGLSLAVLAFGPRGLAPAAALFAVSNLLNFTLGLRMLDRHASLWRIAVHPMVLATVGGAALSLAHIRLPDMIYLPIKMLGDAAVPMMLFALGVRMTHASLKGWKVGLLGGIVCPLTSFVFALPLTFIMPLDAMQRGQLLLFASLPPAVLNFLLAERYRQEPDKVASIVLLGNILALVWVPVGLALGLH